MSAMYLILILKNFWVKTCLRKGHVLRLGGGWWILNFYEMVMFWAGEQLVASQEGMCYMELVWLGDL